MINMSSAFVLLNCDIGAETEIVNEMSRIPGVSETARVSGIYDIVVKIKEESKESMIRLVKQIRAMENVRSSLTMIIAENHTERQ